MLNSTVRGHKAWWGLLGVCLSLLSAPAFSANPAANVSTVFAFDLHTVTSGVVEGSGSNLGMLFGTTADTALTSGGVIYKVSKNGGAPGVIYQLKETDGYSPQATLLLGTDGYLYGSTFYAPRVSTNIGYGSGTIFRVAQDGSGYTTLHTFATATTTNAVTGNAINTDGIHPTRALIQDATYLYGVTPSGGVNGSGTVFRVRKSDGATDVLYSFNATTATGAGSAGDGAYPSSSLTLGTDGRLYGVTSGGGVNLKTSAGTTASTTVGTGTIYSLNIDGSGFQTLYNFTALDDTATTLPGINVDGAQPVGSLLEISPGIFVGTASDGGTPADTTATGSGTVFRFESASNTLTTLYSFDNNHGASPTSNLILDGTLVYGTVSTGASVATATTPVMQFGAFFSINPLAAVPADTYKIEHPLTFAEGSGFTGSMIKASDGDLYSSVQGGNACTVLNGSGYGAVIRYSLTTGGSSTGYASCTQPSSSGGGSMSMGLMWLLAMLGLAPPVCRRLFGVR